MRVTMAIYLKLLELQQNNDKYPTKPYNYTEITNCLKLFIFTKNTSKNQVHCTHEISYEY
jgi:hypothetical protein